MECKKCGSTAIAMIQDSRGLPEAHCADCGYFIKKMTTSEVIDYFMAKLQDSAGSADVDRPMCRYCTEDIFIKQGNRGVGVWVPLSDSKFCPMCGRKKKATDRDY